MKFGSMYLLNRIYDLDYMKKEELEGLYNSNNQNKNIEFSNAKKICRREIDETLKYQIEEIPSKFKSFLDNSGTFVKNEAIILRALTQKTSYDVILNKTKNRRNSINASIKRINPKFNISNKNFEEVCDEIDKIMKKYEKDLYVVADFYDNKIQQLILKKTELEAHLIGCIFKDESLIEEENYRKNAKENDKLLISLSNSIKSFMAKLTKKKEQKEIDIAMIENLQDKADLEFEQKEKLNYLVDNTISKKKQNSDEILDLENEIISIENEIKRLNNNKEKELIDALESCNKEVELFDKKKSFGSRVKNFFKAKFNPSKVIFEEVLNPLNNIITEYEKDVLENMKD